MAIVTRTATLAASTGPVRAIHAGVNSISGKYNSGGTTLSLSSIVLLCKIPVNATVTSLQWYHTTGATAFTVNVGVRDGATTSATTQALLSVVAQATPATGGKNLPYYATGTDGEQYKYIVANPGTGTSTKTVIMSYTIYYTMDP